MMDIMHGACCVLLEHIRTRRDKCPVRSVQHLREEKCPRWSVLETCHSVGVRTGFQQTKAIAITYLINKY